MEFEGERRLYGACNFLGVPGPGSLDGDSDEGEVVIGIRPKSSPLPRRRSSVSDEDSEPDPPLCGSRRVSFADTKGLSLVQVKEFDTWDVPKLPGYDSCEGDNNEAEEYYISTLTFTRPLPNGELLAKVWDQKVELETVELLPGTTTLKGVIRVLNISLTKAVYIRTTFDAWSNHFDLLAEYAHGSSDDLMDYFSFKITLVPPFGEQGARVDFCVRYETPAGTFWANNNSRNYILFCHQRIKDVLKKDNVNKKSCLKSISQNYSSEESISAEEASSQENNPAVTLNLEEEVNTTGAKKTTEGRSETSLKGGTKLVGESRRFSSQRSARKAARMARVRDHFARRKCGESDTERDESTPEAKRAAEQVNVEGVPSYSEDSSTSDLCNALETCLKSPAGILHGNLQASHNMTHNWPEKAEIPTQADLASAGLADTEISDNPLYPTTEGQNVTSSISRAEEETQRQDTHHDVRNNPAAESVDGAISTGINESLSGQNNGTFGTVVAPLYNQMFGKVGSESQRFADWKDPFQTSKLAPDLTQSHISPEKNYSTNAEYKKVKEQKSESLMAENIMEKSNQESKNTPEGPIPLSVNRESQIPSEELQDHSLLFHSLTGTDENNAVTQSDSPKAMASITTQFSLCQQNDITSESYTKTSIFGQNESNADADICENKTKSNTNASPEVDTHFEPLYDFNTKQIQNSAAKESTEFLSPVTCQDAHKQNNSVQEINEMNEDEIQCPDIVSKKAAGLIANTQVTCDSDTIEKMKENDTLIHEPRLEMSVQEDLVLEDSCVKNWETMVEEEEETIVTDCEKSSDSLRSEIYQRVQVENAESDVATEKENKKPAEGLEKTTAAEVKYSSAEVAVVLEYKERVRNETFSMMIAAAQGTEKEEEHIQAAKTEKAATVKKQVDENEEVEKKSEQNKEQILTEQSEMQDVIVRISGVQEMEAAGIEKEVEIHLDNGDAFSGLKKNQEKPVEKIKNDNPNLIYGFDVDEVKTETVALESNWRTTEDVVQDEKHSKQRLDLTPDIVEDVVHTQVTSTEDTGFKDRHGVDEAAHILPEIVVHKEADFQNNKTVMSDCSQDQVVSYALEPDSCFLRDEPESDQVSHDSESAESDSDDEVELYMRCLRAVHAGSQATKDKATGQSSGKRGSISRKKQLPVPMPSIKESLDEEPQHNCLQDNIENTNTTEIQPDGPESNNKPVTWWKETFSWSNISKTLLYSTLVFVFVVVAYHYDFLACFGLYLISLVWLCCQKETPPVKKR